MKKEKTICMTIDTLRSILHLQASIIAHENTPQKMKRMDNLLRQVGVTEDELTEYEDLYLV